MTRVEGFGVGAEQKFFGDVDGDGKDDAVATYCSVPEGLRVEVALSDGSDFVNPGTWLTWPGADGTEKVMLGDVTGDGSEDLVAFRESGGVCEVAVSTGSGFAAPVSWSTGNGVGSDFQFLADVDADGKADAMGWESGRRSHEVCDSPQVSLLMPCSSRRIDRRPQSVPQSSCHQVV